MSISVERQGNEAIIKLGLQVDEVNKGFNKAIAKINKQVSIPGFRKGKAPRNILENHVGKEAVKQEAFEILANECYTKALTDEKLIPVSDPKITESKFEENEDMELTLTVTLKPEPELGEYKGLSVEKKVVEITDKEVDEAIDDLRKRAAKMVVVKDAIIEKGDFAIIDFAGTVDGKPFSGGEGKGYPLEVGSGSFIPGFEEQLVGLKAGDSTDVDVTFPESYFVKELANKEAIFKVHVQDVKRKELPELNDEFVSANSDSKTVEELKSTLKERLQKSGEQQSQVEYERALVMKAVENAVFEVPDIMVEDRVSRMVDELQMSLESRKMNMDMYMKYTGQDMTKIRENQKPTAVENVKTDLVLDAIAKAENLQISEEEVNAEMAAIASQHGASVEDVKKIIAGNRNMGLLLANVLRKKAAHIIIDSAK
ncbi:Trigger factor [bioreactor metagenome]|uniref:peptidylprolyl isomerase n=1 Tax=bioreactor metagenome TaxID=1076179 RepID=A0A644UIW1_9ZZZZ|nr:trigger factor [Acidaminococcaceae bacterium]